MPITNEMPTKTYRIDMNDALSLAQAIAEGVDGYAPQLIEVALILAYGNVAEGLRRGTLSDEDKLARLVLFAGLGAKALVDVVREVGSLDVAAIRERIVTASCQVN